MVQYAFYEPNNEQMEVIISRKEQLEDIIQTAVRLAVRSMPQTNAPMPPVILTDREAQKLLRKSRSTLQRWRNEGILPYKKVNGSILYSREDILALMRQPQR